MNHTRQLCRPLSEDLRKDTCKGEIDEAETSYQRAYDLDRNFADSHGGLALVHALRGRTDDAEAAIRRALRLNPQCPTALYAQTLLLEASGRGDEAMRLLSGATICCRR